MKKPMGIFYTSCRVENHVNRKKSAEVPKVLVDTGAEFSWINSETLNKIGVAKEKKDWRFCHRHGAGNHAYHWFCHYSCSPRCRDD